MKAGDIKKTLVTLAALVLLFWLSRGGNPVLGIVVIAAVEAYRFLRRQDRGLQTFVTDSPRWLMAASILVLSAAATQLSLQLVFFAALFGWLIWLQLPSSAAASQRRALIQAAILQFVSVAAIFTGVTFWRWPATVAWLSTWAVSYLVADNFLASHGERARSVLSAAWALVAGEVSWVSTVWVVSYILLGGTLVIPQAAIILGVLSYCFGGIYVAHVSSKLSRARLVEYLLVGLLLLLIIVVGTKWKAVI